MMMMPAEMTFISYQQIFTAKCLESRQDNQIKRPIIPREIEVAIKSLPTKTCPGLDGFSVDFYHIFK